MAQERLAMKDIRELFRLRFKLGLSQRQASKASGFSRSTIQAYEKRLQESGFTDFSFFETLSPVEIYNTLGFSSGICASAEANTPIKLSEKILPDWQMIREELSRKHMTLMLLCTEYKSQYPEKSYQYSQFCELYKQWSKKLSLVMRQEHKVGEKIFVDYAGTTLSVFDAETGELRQAQVFVGVLGASSYVFAEATWSQGLPDWLMSHRRMVEFFGGVSEIIVPDNLKSGVTKPNRYEAKINESYREFAEHYGTCIIPARVRKPKDKAKVEVSVQVVTRWISMALRKKTFYSLDELNEAIRDLLIKLNQRKMRHLGKSRQELFEQLDKPALKPLPERPYEFGEWKKATANVDYHIAFDNAFYSVPHQLVGKQLWVRASVNTIEVYENLTRICSHRRTAFAGKYVTAPSHRPKAHAEQAKWTPERITTWAASKGESVGLFVKELIATKVHPEQGYRSALGIIRLADKYGEDRLNTACEKAISLESYRYHTINNMLKNGMDKLVEKTEMNLNFNEPFADPANLRGSAYYH